MALWVDKHRPTCLDDFVVHREIADRLRSIADSRDPPHLLMYGGPGCGKKTLIACFLRAVFGGSVDRVKMDNRTFKTPSGRVVEVTLVTSTYHIEMNPGDVGIYDRIVVQEVLKEIASFKNLDVKHPYKIVFLTDVDSLTKEAQHALRRTMEKYSSSCRLILCCQNPSKVIDPLRSRCLGIRVPAPTLPEVAAVLSRVCEAEKLHTTPAFLDRVAGASNRNLRRAVLMLESAKTRDACKPDSSVQTTDWERFVAGIAEDMISEQTPQRLLAVRGKMYELLINCIPADVILKTLLKELLPKLDDELKHEVTHWAAFYEHRVHEGQKDIYHIEAFVAKFMSIYKKFLIALGS